MRGRPAYHGAPAGGARPRRHRRDDADRPSAAAHARGRRGRRGRRGLRGRRGRRGRRRRRGRTPRPDARPAAPAPHHAPDGERPGADPAPIPRRQPRPAVPATRCRPQTRPRSVALTADTRLRVPVSRSSPTIPTASRKLLHKPPQQSVINTGKNFPHHRNKLSSDISIKLDGLTHLWHTLTLVRAKGSEVNIGQSVFSCNDLVSAVDLTGMNVHVLRAFLKASQPCHRESPSGWCCTEPTRRPPRTIRS